MKKMKTIPHDDNFHHEIKMKIQENLYLLCNLIAVKKI